MYPRGDSVLVGVSRKAYRQDPAARFERVARGKRPVTFTGRCAVSKLSADAGPLHPATSVIHWVGKLRGTMRSRAMRWWWVCGFLAACSAGEGEQRAPTAQAVPAEQPDEITPSDEVTPTDEVAVAASPDPAIRIAKTWFSALVQGQTAASLAVSAAPFSMDGKKLLNTQAELTAFYEKVASSKGARPAPSLTASLGGEPTCYQGQPLPNDMVVVVVKRDGSRVAVCLAGNPLKVVGFKD